jgi:cytochrome c biogenesis protein CcmG/thiol:disulfide interchange protein DsbE
LKSKAVILIAIFIIGITLAFLMTRDQFHSEIITVGSAVPDIELIDINQNKLNLSALKGSVVFVNFWATWCEPCIEELPSIEILFRRLSPNPRFKLITILFKDDRQNVLRHMEENGYTFPVYENPDDSAANKFGITGVPETFIFDKQGILRDKKIGPEQWDSPTIMEMLQSMTHEQ